jgi:hypothetical protein
MYLHGSRQIAAPCRGKRDILQCQADEGGLLLSKLRCAHLSACVYAEVMASHLVKISVLVPLYDALHVRIRLAVSHDEDVRSSHRRRRAR